MIHGQSMRRSRRSVRSPISCPASPSPAKKDAATAAPHRASVVSIVEYSDRPCRSAVAASTKCARNPPRCGTDSSSVRRVAATRSRTSRRSRMPRSTPTHHAARAKPVAATVATPGRSSRSSTSPQPGLSRSAVACAHSQRIDASTSRAVSSRMSSGSTLSGSTLSGSTLSGSTLSGSTLSGSTLSVRSVSGSSVSVTRRSFSRTGWGWHRAVVGCTRPAGRR
ncbi:pentapeptide repeat-containing protein [Microbacterium sp. Yaish 1]|uniref:pentapeptide repeat-containing protein n=1 Tax=Microbacterium sp. Yaish 1 TaxID=2025014 RepID=UPI003593E606